MSEVYKWLKHLPGDLNLEKCSKEISCSGVAKIPSPRGHRRILPVSGETAVGKKNASWKAKSRRLSTQKAREHR